MDEKFERKLVVTKEKNFSVVQEQFGWHKLEWMYNYTNKTMEKLW
jgi:hypothetical protein